MMARRTAEAICRCIRRRLQRNRGQTFGLAPSTIDYLCIDVRRRLLLLSALLLRHFCYVSGGRQLGGFRVLILWQLACCKVGTNWLFQK